MSHSHFTILLSLFLALTSCSRPRPDAKTVETESEIKTQAAKPAEILAQEWTAEAFATLSGRLMEVITADGLAAAINVCSQEAEDLLDGVANKHGVIIRRVTERPRNPDNQADMRDLEVMEHYRERIAQGVPLDPHVRETTVRLPLRIAMPLCLGCHGSQETDIAPDTLQAILALYPQDMATGYKEGELRGLWRVDFPPAD